jgi:hypothetical protein
MTKIKSPVIIGGIGGSGTRVVAQILKALHFYIGHDLNIPLDNLSYTLLFKRKKWFYKNHNNKKEIFKGLKILEKSITQTNPKYNISEMNFLFKSTASMFIHGHNLNKDGKGVWAVERLKKIIKGGVYHKNKYIGWGWKEPNSHLILPYLIDYYPNLKYIHTIRNGLDMAYSSNQQQLFNWAKLFNVDLTNTNVCLPETSFNYWLEANKRVIEIGKTMKKEAFHLVNFDKLALKDEKEIKNLINFLGISFSKETEIEIMNIISEPDTIGRHKTKQDEWLKKYKSNIFDNNQFIENV